MSIDYLFCHLRELMHMIADTFSHYYVPNFEIKDFNGLIDGKSFFDLPVKNEGEAYQKIVEISNNNDYTTDNLLDFAYSKENCRLIAIDSSKQTKLKDMQQFDFIGKLENQAHGATMFVIIKKSEFVTKFCHNHIMETQKIVVNLLNGSDNENLNLQQKKVMLLTFNQKLFIHTKIQSNKFIIQVIILMHIF